MMIHSVPWLVPVDGPVIRDGGVVTFDGRIVDIGKRGDIVGKYPQAIEKLHSAVLMPGLINAHTHLELSHLQSTAVPPVDQKFTDWIETVISRRRIQSPSRGEIVASFTATLQDQYDSGVVLIGDIGNEYYEELYQLRTNHQPEIIRMLEYLGPSRQACQDALRRLPHVDKAIAVTAHAPYSTAPDLLQELKKRCNRLGHIFSIHTAESQDERQFLLDGSGNFRFFLEKKNSWDGVFSFAESGFSSTIAYFDQLGLLDEGTLLVHCVHVNENDIRLIQARGSRICLCPGSNQYLRVGAAPVEKMVTVGLLPALGTDSAASNHQLDLWHEMQLVALSHPNLNRSIILAMATRGGAEALRREADLGTLGRGKMAQFLHVSSDALLRCRDEKQLIGELVSGGKPTEISWVSNCYE